MLTALQGERLAQLTIATPDGDREFVYRARSTPAGRRWFDELRLVSQAQLQIKDPWRVYNAPDGLTTAKLAQRFRDCVSTINGHAPGTLPEDVLVDESMPPDQIQERMNYAHTYFETMMHSADNPAQLYVDAPDNVRSAIEQYNLVIHAFEDDARQKERVANGENIDVRTVVTFLGRRRVPLLVAELQDFALPRMFGVAYLNYCMVGKHLLEACDDNDDVTGVLRPQTHMSADTSLWFGHNSTAKELSDIEAKLNEWWDREDIGSQFGRTDPSSAVGYLPVADLCFDRGDVLGKGDADIRELFRGATLKGFACL